MFKAISMLFFALSMIVVSYFTFHLGWGLEMKSWGWFIGLTLLNCMIGILVNGLKEEK